jgi:hypothetical protein
LTASPIFIREHEATGTITELGQMGGERIEHDLRAGIVRTEAGVLWQAKV